MDGINTARMTPELVRCADADALAVQAATRLVTEIGEAIAARGRARVALSGGSTPRKLHARLVEQSVDWPRVELFFGDERVVPADDPASNFRMAKETLLEHVAAGSLHRIETERGASAAAAHYREVIGSEPLDVVLLGMGDDGHTASLFPPADVVRAARGVVVTTSPTPPRERVSLALDVINRARCAMLLVSGAAKAERLREAWDELQRDVESATLPVAMVRPERLVWFADEAAAQRLA